MRSRYSDSARLIEFVLELGGRVAGLVGEAIPDEAKAHLNNAQRELFKALFLIYQHQALGRRDAFEDRRRAVATRSRHAVAPPKARRARSRTTHIDIS